MNKGQKKRERERKNSGGLRKIGRVGNKVGVKNSGSQGNNHGSQKNRGPGSITNIFSINMLRTRGQFKNVNIKTDRNTVQNKSKSIDLVMGIEISRAILPPRLRF